jgi:hypothetical protein
VAPAQEATHKQGRPPNHSYRVCEGESGPGCGIEVTAEVSAFPESLIQCHPRSGLIDIVEIYRTCGTEDNVAVESIHIYMYITGKRGIYEC